MFLLILYKTGIPPWYTDNIVGGNLINTVSVSFLIPFGNLTDQAQVACKKFYNRTLNKDILIELQE